MGRVAANGGHLGPWPEQPRTQRNKAEFLFGSAIATFPATVAGVGNAPRGALDPERSSGDILLSELHLLIMRN